MCRNRCLVRIEICAARKGPLIGFGEMRDDAYPIAKACPGGNGMSHGERAALQRRVACDNIRASAFVVATSRHLWLRNKQYGTSRTHRLWPRRAGISRPRN